MLKKLNLFVLCLLLTACGTSRINSRGGSEVVTTDYSEINLTTAQYDNPELFRVGMLLPLTGTAAKQGQGLKNAALLALDDVKNPNLVLQFYDTGSTPSGARAAIENAINQRCRLIIGPLMSSEVRAISDRAIEEGVPVIAFSTSEEVLQPNIYTLGLLINEQVDRIMTYASQQGRQRFALLVPDNTTGLAVARAAVKSAQKNQVTVSRIAFYAPETSDFSAILKQLTDYSSRHAKMTRTKATLQAKAKAGDSSAKRELARMKTTDSAGDVDFDAVIIPEYGSRLKSAISMFGYYDVFAPKVKFLGTSIWENTSLNKESMVANSWYPTLSRYQSSYFSSKYNNYYGERPSSLYSYAYDGVALASALAKQSDYDLNSALVSPEGYMGINGAFRFFADGTNQHSLDIMEIRSQGDIVIDAAPKKFDTLYNEFDNMNYGTNEFYTQPIIFGKDAALAKSQIFAR